MANFAYMATSGELDPGKPNIPRSIAEAKASPEWPQWEQAINDELENLATMGTWELEDCPAERKPVGCRWVFDKSPASTTSTHSPQSSVWNRSEPYWQ